MQDVPLKPGRGENSVEIRPGVQERVFKSWDSVKVCCVILNIAFSHPLKVSSNGATSHPHSILAHSDNIWPLHKPREIRRCWYWNHSCSAGDSDLGKISPNNDHIPLWFWGDGAECNEQFSVITLTFGSCLGCLTCSLDFCYPLTFVREGSWKNNEPYKQSLIFFALIFYFF